MGGYRVEMSCGDVTSAVSREDAAMCHTGEKRGRIERKQNVDEGKIFFYQNAALFVQAALS